MKNYLCILILFGLLFGQNAQGQIFSQNFNSSTTLSDYISSTPNNGQFNNIAVAGTNTVSVVTNALVFTRGNNTSYFVRTADFATEPYLLKYSFSLTTASTGNADNSARFYIGNNFANDNAEQTAFGRFRIDFRNTNNFRITTLDGTTGSSANFAGTQTVTWFLNKSGCGALNYASPNSTTESLAENQMDIWIGTTRIFAGASVQDVSSLMTDFKFRFFANSGTITIDNLLVEDITPAFPPTPLAGGTYEINASGTNTLGGGETVYTSLTNSCGLFHQINKNGLAGNITVKITSNIAETGTVPLRSWTGGQSVQIAPQNANIVLTLSNILNLAGCTNVTIDGSNGGALTGTSRLTFRHTNANFSGVNILADVSQTTIKECIFESNSSSAFGIVAILEGKNTGNQNITFADCVFRNRTDVAGNPRLGLYCSGYGSSVLNQNITVEDCEFINCFSAGNSTTYGLLINSFTNNFTFQNNHIYQTASYSVGAGIYTRIITVNSTGVDNITIQGNYIGGREKFCGGSAYIHNTNAAGNRFGINVVQVAVANTATLTFQNNTIQNFESLFYLSGSSSSSRWVGFTGSGKLIVKSNLISKLRFAQTNAGTVSGSAQAQSIQGIVYSGTDAGEVTNNVIEDVVLSFTDANATNAFGFGFEGIRLSPSSNGLVVSGNTVGNTTTTNSITTNTSIVSNSTVGISLANTNACVLTNNTIVNLSNNSTNTSSTLYGINQTGTADNTIQNNTIYNLTCTAQQTNVSDNVTVAGIRISAATTSAFSLRGNTIHTIQSSATTSTTSAGILLTGGVNGHIRDNRIYNIRNTSAAALPIASGMVIRNIGNALYFYNNRVSLGLEISGANNTEQAVYIGVWNNLHDTDNLFFAFNSINIAGQASGGSFKTYSFLQGDNPSSALDGTLVNTPLQLYNNIFQNGRTNGGNNIAIAIQDGTTPTSASCGGGLSPDYNVYFASDETKTGEWANTAYGFTAWQTNSGADDNSYSANTGGATPIAFTLPETADLHLNANDQRPDGKAMPISIALGFPLTIDFDVDNEFRRSTDAGADEYEQTVTFIQVDDNWHNPLNWQVQGSVPPRYSIPNCADNVIIPTGTTVRVYNGGTENPSNTPAFFYTLTIQNGGTLELKDGTNTYSCWYNDQVPPALPTFHKGEVKIETGGTLLCNNNTLYVSGKFTNSGTFTKGTSTTIMNQDQPITGNSCLDSYVNSYNNLVATSNIDGASNTNFHHLTITNNGETTILNTNASDKQIRVGDATTDLGNLNITGTGWIAINGNRLILEGDLTENTGSIAGSPTSDLIFYGAGNLTGTVKLRGNTNDYNTFENLHINRPTKGRVIFDTQNGVNTITVNNQLDLTNGVFQTGATPLTDIILHVTNTATSPTTGAVINYATSGGSGANSWVYGRLRRNIDGSMVANAYGFPVGSSTRLQLIRVDVNEAFDASTTYITGYFNPSSPVPSPATLAQPNPNLVEAGNSYDAVCPTGFWNLTPNTFPTGKYDIEIYPVGFACTGSRPTLAKRPDGGGDWTFENSTYVSASKRTGFTAFSDFAPIHVSVPLPLTLLSFSGEVQKNTASLYWQTVGELNTSHFEIERSQDALNFHSIGKKDAKGNFAGISNYTFTDQNPQTGINYYRLKQIDLDGRFTYSPIVALRFEGRQDMSLFPNPNNGQFTIKLPETEGAFIKVQITEATGRVVSVENLAYPAEKGLELKKALPKGMYFVVINSQNKSYRQKIIIF